jgi:hypothetical protein
LIGPDGRIIEDAKVIDGRVAFCDFGFGEHSIRIRENCGSVTLNRIRFTYGVRQVFSVILNNCFVGADGGVYPPACLLYLRVYSTDGKKLSDAAAVDEPANNKFAADRYGRLFLFVPTHKSESFTITAPDYWPENVDASCAGLERMEREIRLKHK